MRFGGAVPKSSSTSRVRVAFAGAVVGIGVTGIVLLPPGRAGAAPLAVVDGESLDVSADRLEIDVERGTALLRGNVSLSFAEIEIRCPTVDIKYDRSPRVSSAHGAGGVTARFKGIEAAADTIDFDATSRKVGLSGNVRLSQGRGWIRAERAALDISSGKVSLEEVKGSIPVEPPKR